MKDSAGNTGLFEQAGYDFMATAFEVYNEMGSGFLEDVYHEALEIELTRQGVPFISRPPLFLHDKGVRLKKQYVADLIVIGEIIVELKAVRALAPEHEAQLLNISKPLANESDTWSISVHFPSWSGSGACCDLN